MSSNENSNLAKGPNPNSSQSLDFEKGKENGSHLEAELATMATEIDKMIAESLKDVTEEEGDDPENDDELLCELQHIAGNDVEDEGVNEKPTLVLPATALETVDLLKQRMSMYKEAEANAKQAGENAKERRVDRGLKTLNNLLKRVNSGQDVNADDIPPEVFVKPIGEDVSSNAEVK